MENKEAIDLWERAIKPNLAYISWVLFYVVLFSVITAGGMLLYYFITITLAFTPLAEKLWRWVNGVRPLRLNCEKERLLPLFKEVYDGALKIDAELSSDIELYIKEDMTINAFAFGKGTLILTRGSIMLLSDECLKGLMAHELGHFSYKHTHATLLIMVANLPMTFFLKKLTDLKNYYDNSEKRVSIFTFIFRAFIDYSYFITRAISFIGELILMKTSRENEYVADNFAHECGFGKDLTDVLIEIYEVSVSKPQSVREQFRSSHPHITLRIERLEGK